MNQNEFDLNKEENKQKIMYLIQSQKQQIKEEEKKRQDLEERNYFLNQQRQQLEQKLVSQELAMRRKNDDFLIMEQGNQSLKKKIEQLEILLHNKPKGLLNIFSGSNKDTNLQQELLLKQEELDIKNCEIERIHQQVFDLKQQLNTNEENYEIQFDQLKGAIKELQDQIECLQREKEQLIMKMNEQQKEKDQQQIEMENIRKILNELEDQNKLYLEKIKQQSNQYQELQNILVQKQDEIKRNYLEQDENKKQLTQIKEFYFQIIVQLENEVQTIQCLQQIKSMSEQVFGIDKRKEQRQKEIKYEKDLQKEILVSKKPYDVFEKAKEKIIKMGKQLEQLEKRNKQLSDKVMLYESKRMNTKSDIMSDKTSVI